MIDFGGSGAGNGPFLSWLARASVDGEFNGKSWVLRTEEGKTAFTAISRGVVFDIDGLKLGWCRGDGTPGTAPEWKWNASVNRFEPKPGDDWKRGFSIPIAVDATTVVVWEQAQAGGFSAVQELFGLIGKASRQAGHLPVVRYTGETTKLESKRGMTFAPKLEIVKWVPRPAAFGGGDVAFEPKAEAKAEPKREMADADNDMPF